jgi:hypothetical protein
MVKKFAAFYETWMFMTVPAAVLQASVFWARWILSLDHPNNIQQEVQIMKLLIV